MAKKIIAIVSLVIVGVLMATTIILANITIDNSIDCATPNSVWIYKSNISNSGDKANQSQADEIVSYINSASKGKLLSGLFNGELDKVATVKQTEKTTATLTSPSSVGYTYFVRFQYNEPQILKEDGEDFLVDGKPYYYKDLYFGLKQQEEGRATYEVFVIPYYLDAENTKPNQYGSYAYKYYYEFEADFTGLYSYISARW